MFYLHDKTLQAHSIIRVPFAFVEFQIVVEYQVGLHVGRYCYSHCGGSWNYKFMNFRCASSESFEYFHAFLVLHEGKCNAIIIKEIAISYTPKEVRAIITKPLHRIEYDYYFT